MAKRKEIIKGHRAQYITYEDRQSLEETHEMLVKALPGQSYVLSPMHKVNTSEVTGMALKKISVGGKGGFGSQGDARDQEKQVDVTARVMVMSPPSQEAFDHKSSLTEVVVGFEQKFPYKPILMKKGDKLGRKVLDPRRASKYYVMHKGKWKRKWSQDAFITLVTKLGRDYDEFAHSANWDASDCMRAAEHLLSGEQRQIARDRYDMLCGYKGAWKYVGLNGAEHRRYEISIVNTLNEQLGKYYPTQYRALEQKAEWHKRNPEESDKKSPNAWTNELSVARHHKDLHLAMNKLWRDGDEEAFDEWMHSHNNDHAYSVVWYLDKHKPEMWSVYNNPDDRMVRVGAGDWRLPSKPAGKLIKSQRVKMSDKYEAIREDIKELTEGIYFDLKAVYRYEGTTKGKVKYLEAEKLPRSLDWKCEDRDRRFKNKDYYKNLRNEEI